MTALANALQQAGVTSSNFVFFDLPEHIEERLMSGELKARVLASLAWVVDMQTISAARSVFYASYREVTEVNTIDAFNEFIVRCSELAAEGAHTEEVGFKATDAWSKLLSLLRIRQDMHDLAGKHSVRRYDPKTLYQIMADEKQQSLTGMDHKKVKVMAEALSDGDSELAKLMTEQLTSVHEARFADAFISRRKILPAIRGVLEYAGSMLKIDPHGQYETFAFHKLPIDVQAGLIGQAQKAIDRALTDMAAMRSITVPEYATYLKEGQLLKRELDTVLKSPKFAEV